jgi:hypothetical protein
MYIKMFQNKKNKIWRSGAIFLSGILDKGYSAAISN